MTGVNAVATLAASAMEKQSMHCPNCEYDSESSERFCVRCGHQFSASCPSCGREVPPDALFCGSCGTRLGDFVSNQIERSLADDSKSSTSPVSSPDASNQPASFANGRYEVRRFLGEGGKKKVYLAHDNLLDRDVAFALIKTEGLDDTSRDRS